MIYFKNLNFTIYILIYINQYIFNGNILLINKLLFNTNISLTINHLFFLF